MIVLFIIFVFKTNFFLVKLIMQSLFITHCIEDAWLTNG